MPVKTKIFKVLPYWILFLLFTVCVQTAGFLVEKNNSVFEENKVNQPQVLGASTSIPSLSRGTGNQETKIISQVNKPDLSKVNAQSFLVFDLASGQTLLERNSSQKLAIASLTKLMTALVAYNKANLNGEFKVSPKDALDIKPSLGLISGDKVRVLDIFSAMIIGSCNDAALALADYTTGVTGENFVGLMNRQAIALGMQDSQFSNPMGFDSNANYSTAQDLKLLISAVQQLSTFTDLGRRVGYEFNGSLGKSYYAGATNTLIKNHPDIQAIKTGFTNEANGAMATKVQIGNRQIVILVLDSQNREGDTLKLKAAVASGFSWE